MMAPPLQAIVLAASSMLLLLRSSAQLLSEPPSSPTTTAVASAPLKPSGMLYSMQFRVGSTAVSGVIDTGSDLIWTNNSQLFDSLVSCPLDAAGKDMGRMTCCNGLSTFERKYGDDKYVRGVMGEAKLTFAELGDESSYTTPDLYIGSAVLPNCHLSSVTSTPPQACRAYQRGGIVGLGRGELSLVTQLKLHSFSYCLPGPDHSSGSEATGQIKFNVSLKNAQTTKLATIPASSKYYLKLEKLIIEATKTEVELSKDCPKMESNSGDGGLDMIIDSGSTFTTLPENAFDAIKKYVEDQINQKKETGHCYDGPYPSGLGSILLHFCDGVRMEIPAKNYLYQEETAENGHPQFCLTIKPRADGEHGKNILGVYQQRGMHMLFDIKENKLSFAKTSACAPSEEDHATM